jgi:hypothetical protein
MLEIVIDLDAVPVHQVRNFGEVLFHAFMDGKPASVSLADVDRTTDQLRVIVRYSSKRRVRSTIRTVERLLAERLLATRARISQIDRAS